MSGDTVFSLVAGAFDEARACALLAEIERCADCSFLLHEAGRAVAEDVTDGSATLPWLDGPGVLRVGSIVAGRFRVLRLVGRGGMGEVYEALDNELGELVALKTIRTGHASVPSSIERFRQEVRLARRVVHPHVCRVLEFGRHQVEGAVPIYFLTMELLRGELLSQYVARRGRSSPLESVVIASQICAGLCAIHGQGVLHRDIKPSNVMLCSGSGAGDAPEMASRRAVLLDFGVARSLALEPTTHSDRALIGTPDYMAPEQLQARALTPATDVYALGIVLFELLAGELPFAQDPVLTRALKRLQGGPPIASTGAAELPSKLTRLVARCLAVAPAERPQSAAELLQELSALERELSTPPPSQGGEGTFGIIAPARARVARRLLLACAILAGMGAMVALGLRTTEPSAAVVSAPAIRLPPRAVSPLESARVRPGPGSTAERAVLDAAALQLNQSRVDLAAQRGVSGPRALVSMAGRSVSAAGSARAPAPLAPSCSPPFYFDGDGFRVYRKECL